MLGFEKVKWKDDSFSDGREEEYYILNQERIDMREFNIVVSIIDDVFKVNNLTPLTKNMSNNTSGKSEEFKTSKITVPVNSRVNQ